MKLAEARSSEFHSAWGVKGNQEYRSDLKDGELREREISPDFALVFRFKDRDRAVKAAHVAHGIVANPKVGYSQNNGDCPRTTLFDEMKKANWIPDDIKNECNTDCSAMMAVVLNAVGIKVSKDMYTGNMRELIMATGEFCLYNVCNGIKYEVGDILWREGHTAIVIPDGEDEPNVRTVSNCKSINFREKAGTKDATVICTINGGEKVELTGESSTWYEVKYKGKIGWVSGKYLS